MIAILVQEVEAFHCHCPHLPIVPEEASDKEELKEGPQGLSLEAVGGLAPGSHFTSDEEEESLVVVTLVEDDGDGGEEEWALNCEVEIVSDTGSAEGAYQEYLQHQVEDAHLERMRENPSLIYSPRYPVIPLLITSCSQTCS